MPGTEVEVNNLPVMNANDFAVMLQYARQHRILPNLLRQFTTNPAKYGDSFEEIIIQRRAEQHHMLMLQSIKNNILKHCPDDQLAVVKGPSFAESIYPRPFYRTYLDLDLLVRPEFVDELATILGDLNFYSPQQQGEQGSSPETKWYLADNKSMLVEVHTNMVHSDRLRRVTSLAASDILDAPNAPSTQLMVAVTNGMVSDQFKRIFQLVDVVQAASKLGGVADEERFQSFAKLGGNGVFAFAALTIAGKLLDHPKSLEIAKEIGFSRWAKVCQTLTSSVLLTAPYQDNSLPRWTRKLVRLLLYLEASRGAR